MESLNNVILGSYAFWVLRHVITFFDFVFQKSDSSLSFLDNRYLTPERVVFKGAFFTRVFMNVDAPALLFVLFEGPHTGYTIRLYFDSFYELAL